MNFAVVILIVIYIAINVITARKLNTQEMKEHFIHGQCTVGMIFSNIFYSPAWFLKCVRKVVLQTIK